jgi:hypothetical protein
MKYQSFSMLCGVSEWLLLNSNSAIFKLFYGKNKLHFDEMMMMMMTALY